MSLNQRSEHYLLSVPMHYIHDWTQWKANWEQTSLVEILHGLLHIGFNVEFDTPPGHYYNDEFRKQIRDQRRERICFYLDLADGHNSGIGWTCDGETRDSQEPRLKTVFGPMRDVGELRRHLSKKAFQAVCVNLFKDRRDEMGRVAWINDVIDLETLKKILWFFRPEGHNLSNHDDDDYNRTARNFAFTLCKYIFEFQYLQDWYNKEVDEFVHIHFQSVRPQVIEVLHSLGRLESLFNKEWYEKLDFACFLKLADLAMNQELYFRDSRPSHRLPETLEEAVAGGSSAAHVLHTLMIIGKERKRLKKKAALERELLEKERQIEKLKA